MDLPATSPAATQTMPARHEFDEDAYLQLHADVAAAVAAGVAGSGWQHYTLHGFREGRPWVRRSDPLAGVSREIAEGDGMYRENRDHYFETGESALHAIESALFAARRPASSVASLLDLPCGYGRVLRFLRKAFPHAELTACDLNRDGVEFCARTFRARGLVSREDPRAIPLRAEFDVIWCGSLLTHFDAARCEAFLGQFQRWLHPNGILVFTTHGRRCEVELTTGRNRCGLDERQVAALLKEYHRTGFGYVDYAPGSGYGISLSLPSYVLSHFVQRPGWQLLGYREGGWDRRQDVVCLQRTP
jgi:SAM-dependent methyltransferase